MGKREKGREITGRVTKEEGPEEAEQEEVQETQSVADDEDIQEPPRKWLRKCGICGVPGHTRRTCQKQC